MPRGVRRGTQRAPAPSPPSSPTPDAPAQPDPHAGRVHNKKRTVADNAKAIGSLETQISTMSQLLSQVVERLPLPANPAAAAPAEPADFELSDHEHSVFNHNVSLPHRGRHRSDYERPHANPYPTRQRHNSVFSFTSPSQGLRPRRRDHVATNYRPMDPLGARSPRRTRDLPSTLHDLEESGDLQEHVANLVTATLAPSNLSGKKAFAHSFIKRRTRKSRTGLGDLTLAEYNLGFMRLINYRDTDPADKPFMFRHLEKFNEDACAYEFNDVRKWSEEVCGFMAEGDMTWDDNYNIDLLRLKFSQRGRGLQDSTTTCTRDNPRRPTDALGMDSLPDLPADVKSARPAPPCRGYNAGSCHHSTHHVVNGYRHLHICSSCIYYKCIYLLHPERDCKSKEFRTKKAQASKDPKDHRDPGPGFGR